MTGILPRIRAVFLSIFLTVALTELALGELYQFIDQHGTIHLTNVPTDPRFKRIDLKTSRQVPRVPPAELEMVMTRHSRLQGIHPALLRAVIKVESDFNPSAVSKAGAIGLMQLMPGTASDLNVRDPFNPEENVSGGSRHLRRLLDRFHGNLPLALAAYNAGEHVVDRYQRLPPILETRTYVIKVLRYFRKYLSAESSSHFPSAPMGPATPPWSSVY